jgi:hypothetical protein
MSSTKKLVPICAFCFHSYANTFLVKVKVRCVSESFQRGKVAHQLTDLPKHFGSLMMQKKPQLWTIWNKLSGGL